MKARKNGTGKSYYNQVIHLKMDKNQKTLPPINRDSSKQSHNKLAKRLYKNNSMKKLSNTTEFSYLRNINPDSSILAGGNISKSNSSKNLLIPSVSLKRNKDLDMSQRSLQITYGKVLLSSPKNQEPTFLHYKGDLKSQLQKSSTKALFKKLTRYDGINQKKIIPDELLGCSSDQEQSKLQKYETSFNAGNTSPKNSLSKGAKILKGLKNQSTKINENDQPLTPYDFIQLIQEDGSITNEFCYLKKMSHAYDLRIVEFQAATSANISNLSRTMTPSMISPNDEYITISSRGVSYFSQENSRFVPLERWKKQAFYFKKLMKLEFFSKYRLFKNFAKWKKHIRKTAMKSTTDKLRNELMIGDNFLRRALLGVKDSCFVMESDTNYCKFDDCQNVMEFFTFKACQQQFIQNEFEKRILEIEEDIKNNLINNMSDSMREFKEENKISTSNESKGIPLLIGDEKNLDMPYTKEATLRIQQQKFKKFLKLIEFMIVDSKIKMMSESTQKIVRKIQDENETYEKQVIETKYNYPFKGKQYIKCSVKINIDEKIIQLKPTRQDLNYMFEEIVNRAIVKMCRNHKRIINDDQILQIIYDSNDKIVKEPQTNILKVIIMGDDRQQKIVNSLNHSINSTYSFLEMYSNRFGNLVEMYFDNLNKLNAIDTYQAKDHQIIKNSLQKWKNQLIQINSLSQEHEAAIFLLDFQQFKNNAIRCVTECLEKMKKVMPEIYLSTTKKLITQILVCQQKMRIKPIQIEDFIQFQKNKTQISSKMDAYADQLSQISCMWINIKENCSSSEVANIVKQEQEQQLGKPQHKLNILRTLLEEAEMNTKTYETNAQQLLKNKIPEIKDEIYKLYNNKMKTSKLQANSTIQEVSEAIQEYQSIHDQIAHTIKQIKEFQQQLSMEEYNEETMPKFSAYFSNYKKIWKLHQALKSYKQEIMTQPWTTVDIEQVKKQVDYFINEASNLEKHIKTHSADDQEFKVQRNDTNVLYDVLLQAKKMKPLIETVECLRDKSLLEKEWKQIRTYFQKINKEKSYAIIDIDNKQATMKDIENEEISEQLDFIQSVVYRSKKQLEIQNKISSVNRFWSEKTTDNNVKILAENFEIMKWWDIIMEIDQKITLINGISEETQVQGQQIKQSITSNKNMFDALRAFMTLWEIHQGYMFYFKPIFENAYWKSNPKEHKLYTQPCGQWNKLIKQGKQSTIKKWATNQKNIKIIKDNIEQLQQLKNSVEDFLNVKRQIFPKFFFLSNEELLHVLQSDKEIRSIEDHISKVFTCVKSLEQKQHYQILVSTSSQSLIVKFPKAISNLEVQQIFKLLEEGIKNVIKSNLRSCLSNFEKDDFNKKKWIKDHLLQSLLFIQKSEYTKIIEEDYMNIVQSEDLSQYLIYQNTQIKQLQIFLKENTNDPDLSVGKIQTLIIQELLHRQITETLLKKQIIEKDSFEWQSQIRCYHNADHSIENFTTKFLVNEVDYGFEFVNMQGSYPYMMFSEKEAIQLTMALKLRHVPVIKGRENLIQNFSKFNAKYYRGILCNKYISQKYLKNVCFGTYLESCFVEFMEAQKLRPEQISIVANFLKEIHSALQRNDRTFNFGWKKNSLNIETISAGVVFKLSDTCNISEFAKILPFNNKSLEFKTMPYALYLNLIMEIRKKNNKNISSKLMKFVDLIHDVQGYQIINFQHIRNLLKEQKFTKVDNLETYFVKEIMQIVSEQMVSAKKIAFYKKILLDIFLEDKSLHEQMMESTLINSKLTKDKSDFKYVVNSLVQSTDKKSICVIAGPTQSGKISVINEAYKQRICRGSDVQVLNIDILNEEQLFGCHINDLWKEGILVSKVKKLPLSKEEWFVFEGSYCPKTLDILDRLNHHYLQLSNGEIVFLSKRWKFVFSIYNLDENASNLPKNVDIIQSNNFVSIKDSIELMTQKRIKPHFEKDSQNKNLQNFKTLYNKCGSKDLKFQGGKNEYLRPENVLRYLINTLDALLATIPYEIKLSKEFSKGIEKIFIWALYWCVGSSLQASAASKHEKYLFENTKSDIQYSQNLGLIRLEFDTPAGTLQKIKDPEILMIKNQLYMETLDLKAKSYYVELMIKSNFPVLMIGKSGSGKSKFMEYLQSTLNPEVYTFLPIKLQKSMNWQDFKDILLNKTRISFKPLHKKCFCSSTNKKLVLFIDDFNTLDINSRIGEFVMACVKDGYYYDTTTNQKIYIYNIAIVAAENDSYESRIDNKFMKYFKPIFINQIEIKEISQIYKLIVDNVQYLRDIFDKCVSLHSQVMTIQSNGLTKREFPFTHKNAIRIMQAIKDYAEKHGPFLAEDKEKKQHLAKVWAYTSRLEYTSYNLSHDTQEKIEKQIMNFLNLIIENCKGRAKPVHKFPQIMSEIIAKNSLIKADGHHEDYYEYLCFLMAMSLPQNLLTIGEPLPEFIKAEALQIVAQSYSLQFIYAKNKQTLKKIEFKRSLIYISAEDSDELLKMLGFVTNSPECRFGRYIIDCQNQAEFSRLIKYIPQVCSMFRIFTKKICLSRILISSEYKNWLEKLETQMGQKLSQREQISIIANLGVNQKKIKRQISQKKKVACTFVDNYVKLRQSIEDNVKRVEEINIQMKDLQERDEFVSTQKKQVNEALNTLRNSGSKLEEEAEEERIQNKKKMQEQLGQLETEVAQIKSKRKQLVETISEIQNNNKLCKQIVSKMSSLNAQFQQSKQRIQKIENSEETIIFCLSLYYLGIKNNNKIYIDFVEKQESLNVIDINHILKVVFDINPSDIRQEALLWVLEDKKIIVNDCNNRFLKSIKKAFPKIRIIHEPHSLNNLYNQPIIYTGRYVELVSPSVGSSNFPLLTQSLPAQLSLAGGSSITPSAGTGIPPPTVPTIIPIVLSTQQLTIITKEDQQKIPDQLKSRTFLKISNSYQNQRETIKDILYSQKQRQSIYQIVGYENQFQQTFLHLTAEQDKCIKTFIDPNQKDLKKIKSLLYSQWERLKAPQQNIKNLQTSLTLKYQTIIDFCCLIKNILKSIQEHVIYFDFSDKKFEDLILVSMGVKPSGQKTFKKLDQGFLSKRSLGRTKSRRQISNEIVETKLNLNIQLAESPELSNEPKTEEAPKEILQQSKEEEVPESEESFVELFKKRMTNEMLTKIILALKAKDSLIAYIIFGSFLNEHQFSLPSDHRQSLIQIAKEQKISLSLSEIQSSLETKMSEVSVEPEPSPYLLKVFQSLINVYSAIQQDSNSIIEKLIKFGDASLNKSYEDLLAEKYNIQIQNSQQNFVVISNQKQNPYFILEKYLLSGIEDSTWCYILESQPNTQKIVQIAQKCSIKVFIIIDNKNPNAFSQLKQIKKQKDLNFIFLYPNETSYFQLIKNFPPKYLSYIEQLTIVYAEDSTFIYKKISETFIKTFSNLHQQRPQLQPLSRIPFYEEATELLKNIYKAHKINQESQQFYTTRMLNEIVSNLKHLSFNQLVKMLVKVCYSNQKEKQLVVIKQAKKLINKKQNLISTFVEFFTKDYLGFEDVVFEGGCFIGQNPKTLFQTFSLNDPQQIVNLLVPQPYRKKYPINSLYFPEKNAQFYKNSSKKFDNTFFQQKISSEIDKILSEISTNIVLQSQNAKKEKLFYKDLIFEEIRSRINGLKRTEENIKKFKRLVDTPVKILSESTLNELRNLKQIVLPQEAKLRWNNCAKTFVEAVQEYVSREVKSIEYLDKLYLNKESQKNFEPCHFREPVKFIKYFLYEMNSHVNFRSGQIQARYLTEKDKEAHYDVAEQCKSLILSEITVKNGKFDQNKNTLQGTDKQEPSKIPNVHLCFSDRQMPHLNSIFPVYFNSQRLFDLSVISKVKEDSVWKDKMTLQMDSK